jgi:hypothetical protein
MSCGVDGSSPVWSIGSPPVSVRGRWYIAYCRYNLLHERCDATEVFTREWEQHTGRTFHRWADIATIIGLLDSQRRHPPAGRERYEIEATLERAINDIDGA